MSERLTLQDLIDLLAQKKDLTKKDAETFLREFIAVVSETIESNELVRIKDFGTFKLTKVSARKSVDVNTGEEIEIATHYRLNFTPDKALRDEINKPFAHFESVILEEGVTFKDEEKLFKGSTNYKTPQELDTDEEDMEIDTEFISKKDNQTQTDSTTTNTDTIEEVKKQNKTNRSTDTKHPKKSDDIKTSKDVQNSEDADMYSSEKMKENISNALSRDSESESSDQEGFYAQGTIEERIEKILNYKPQVIEVVKVVQAKEGEAVPIEEKVGKEEIIEEEVSTEVEEISNTETEETDTQKELIEEEVSSELANENTENPLPHKGEEDNIEIVEEQQTEETVEIEATQTEEQEETIAENDNIEEKEENTTEETQEEEEMVEATPLVENNVEQETENKMEENKEKPKNYISEYDDEETTYDDVDYNNYYASSSKKTYIYIAIAVVIVVGAFLAYRFYSAPEDANDILIENIDDTDEYNALVAETAGGDTGEKKETEKVAETPAEKVVEKKNTANLGVEVLKYGQTLRLISEKYYGDRSFWVYIYKENKSKISNPNSVPVGTSLTIPSLDKYNVSVKNAKDRSNAAQMERDILTSTGNF